METLESSSGRRSTIASTKGAKNFFMNRRNPANRKLPTASVNPLKKLQLSILNNRYIPISPNPDRAFRLLPKKSMSFKQFAKHMILISKYEVLLKLEFQAASRNEIYTKHRTIHANKANNETKNTYPKKCVPCKFITYFLIFTYK